MHENVACIIVDMNGESIKDQGNKTELKGIFNNMLDEGGIVFLENVYNMAHIAEFI